MAQDNQFFVFLRRLGQEVLRALLSPKKGASGRQSSAPAEILPPGAPSSGASQNAAIPSDFVESPGQFGAGATRELFGSERSNVTLSYQPHSDDDPDPGEIVWTWVPYEENDGRGKDRPVLILGRLRDGTAVGCFMTSKDHEGRRGYLPMGRGNWDAEGRESWICLERVLAVSAHGMRREGDIVDTDTFVKIAAGVQQLYGWTVAEKR